MAGRWGKSIDNNLLHYLVKKWTVYDLQHPLVLKRVATKFWTIRCSVNVWLVLALAGYSGVARFGHNTKRCVPVDLLQDYRLLL